MRNGYGWIGGSVVFLVLIPSFAAAGRPRGGNVVSPFGTMYNTNSPEWKQAGGNPLVYEQIMEQKAMMRQQQAYMKQQQMYMQMQKKTAAQNPSKSNAAAPALQTLAPRKKKKRRTYDPTHPVSGTATKTPAATTPTTTSKTPDTP